jgi:hypothetical protein
MEDEASAKAFALYFSIIDWNSVWVIGAGDWSLLVEEGMLFRGCTLELPPRLLEL